MALFRRRKIIEAPVEMPVEVPTEVRSSSGQTYMPARSHLSDSGADVNELSALALPAAFRAANLIANTIASLPVDCFRGGKEIDCPKIINNPFAMMFRTEIYAQIVMSLLLRGNAYLVLGDFDRLGYPQTFYVADPSRVYPRLVRGEMFYDLGTQTFTSLELLHIRGFSFPGSLVGVGVIDLHRNTIGASIAQDRYAHRFFADSAIPPAVLHVDREDLSPEEAELLGARWQSRWANGARNPAVLTPDIKFEVIGFTPEAQQLLETRKYSVAEIALAFGLEAWRLGGDAKPAMTYSNLGQEATQFLKFTLLPWIIRIEEALSTLLPRGTEVKFNVDGLLRGSLFERATTYEILIRSGVYVINDARALEDLPDLPWGNEPYIQKAGPDTAVGKSAPDTKDDLEPDDAANPSEPDADDL